VHESLELCEVHNRLIFANRQEAGRRLAAELSDLVGRDDVVVLGLPRGGVPVAYEVARSLGAPLDVFVVRKVGAPRQPELALGAVASGGAVVWNDEIVRHIGINRDRLASLVAAEREVVEERDQSYRGERGPLDVEHRTAVVVDDGLATGATMRAALAALRARNVGSLIVGVPVAPAEAIEDLEGQADRVAVVATPDNFVAVGAWYDDFHQVTDDEVRQLLN
jgi:putative phosphoribosyl transferase